MCQSPQTLGVVGIAWEHLVLIAVTVEGLPILVDNTVM